MSLADSAGGLQVTLGFEVAYVDSLGQHAASQTYAKEVTVEVSTPAIMIAGDSLRVRYSRAFVYPSTVDFARSVAAAP
ncbi:MAG TPA: hypothetical protein VMO47_07580 [Rhodothermales bacterium]|nr:hypothetical protein [Rhodothermales bacterium]